MQTKLSIVVALVVGCALGFLGSRGIDTYRTNSAIQDLANTSGADLSMCQGDIVDKAECVDAALLAHALQTQSSANCAYLSHESAKQDCQNRLQFILGLGDTSSACLGASKDSPCLDLAIMRSAIETGNASACQKIGSSILSQACVSVVTGQTTVATSDYTFVASRSLFTYGLQCDNRDQNCVENKKIFNRAVTTNQADVCDSVAFAADLCRSEVRLYQAFTTNDVRACGSTPEDQQQCSFVVALAKALEMGNASACANLNEQDRVSCQQVVETNKEPRFAYLKETL